MDVKKTSFNSVLPALLSRYRPNSKFATHLFESLQYLVDSKSLDIIADYWRLLQIIGDYWRLLQEISTFIDS